MVGAGVAGLSAARHLCRAGVSVLVCEAGEQIGGRVRTDEISGFRLDRGFQVLLPAYPEIRREVDTSALMLRPFATGLVCATAAGRRWLAGPRHGRPAALDTLGFAAAHPLGSATLAVLSLRDALVPASLAGRVDLAGSAGEELRRWRVSDPVTNDVLRPLLAGVFLDPALAVPARLFHLIWRCFLRGGAALPAAGMQALPSQLARALPDGSVRTSTQISEASGSGVVAADGEHIRARAVVLATDGITAARLAPGLRAPAWHAVTTFYYRAPSSPLGVPILAVDGLDDLLLSTAVLSDVAPSYAPAGSALVTASVPGRADAGLEPRVRRRLARLYETATGDWELIAAYPITSALPVLRGGEPFRRPVRLAPGRYVCGDHRDTPSVQGALFSGRRAASAVLADLRGHPATWSAS